MTHVYIRKKPLLEDDEEIVSVENKNTIAFSLSKNILKTETATISALSLVSYSYDL